MGHRSQHVPLGVLPDATLALLVADGDDSAFETLYMRHRTALQRYAMSMLHHRQDTEEALQVAMMKAYRALSVGRRPSQAVRPWLAAIVRNECLDVLSRRSARPDEPLAAEIETPGQGPHEQVETRERLRELRSDLAELPVGQRRALMLHGVVGLPHAEVARIVGGTAGEARNLVHEARTSLVEFEEGRRLSCDDITARVSGGDGRVLRGRRVRAHLRTCESCRARVAALPLGRRVAAWLPLPSLAAVKGLFGWGSGAAGPALGGAGAATVAVVASVIAVGGLGGGHGRAAVPAGGEYGLPTAAVSRTAAAADLTGLGPDRPTTGIEPVVDAPATRAPSSQVRAPSDDSPAKGDPQQPASPSEQRQASAEARPASGAESRAPDSPSGIATPPISTPAVTVPSVKVPSVTVPSVTVPSVTVPSVKVPSVKVPSVTVGPVVTPPVETPEVQTPQVQTPQVQTPQIQTPQIAVPAITVPSITVPGVTLPGGSK
ncbi:MAG: sigma-70 family RNA polymerase sigma factor [Thermoleophilia bacterium]